MNPLRLNTQTVLWLLVAVQLPLFFIGGPSDYALRSVRFTWNFGHILFFTVLSYLLLRYLGKALFKSFLGQLVLVILISVMLGGLVEWAQSNLGRDSDYVDMLRNSIGALIGFCCYRYQMGQLTSLNKKEQYCWWSLCVVITIALMWQVAGVTKILVDEWHQRSDFPVLADFEVPSELGRWGGSAKMGVGDVASMGSKSLKVVLGTSRYSGVRLESFVSDWSAYQRLLIDVYNNEPQPLRLTMRIHDRRHRDGERQYSDRYNHSFNINSGWNSLEVDLEQVASSPIARKMDLTAIDGLGLFITVAKKEQIIFIDNVRLLN